MSGRILVVEDDRDIRETLVDALEGEGYDVISAVDGVDALERLRSEAQSPSLPQFAISELREFCNLQRGSAAPLRPYSEAKRGEDGLRFATCWLTTSNSW